MSAEAPVSAEVPATDAPVAAGTTSRPLTDALVRGCTGDCETTKVADASRPMRGPAPDEIAMYRWGSVGEDMVEVQIRDLSSDEQDSLSGLAAKYPDSIPAGTPEIPPRFSLGDAYVVATETHIYEAKLDGWGIGQDDEWVEFYIYLAAPGVDGGSALVAEKGKGELSTLRGVEGAPARAADYRVEVTALARAAGYRDKVKNEHLTVIEAALPPPHAVLIAVELPPHDRALGDLPMTALLVGDTGGKISGEIHGIEERLDTYGIVYLVDIGRDGTDEAIVQSCHDEGCHQYLLTFDSAGTPSLEVLSGAGP